MLGHFFYFIGFILFLVSLGTINRFFQFQKVTEWMEKFEKVTKKKPTPADFKGNDVNGWVFYNFIMIANSLWLFFGLLTQSWKFFTLILVISFAINQFTRILGKYSRSSQVLNLIKLIIMIFTIGLLTFNHFHLHQDLWKLITQK